MKKFVCAILAMVILLAVATSASASETGLPDVAVFTIHNVPCEAIADDQLYQYNGGDNNCVYKDAANHTIQIRHYVTEINADETNRIAAYSWTTQKTMGASWKPADNAYYPIISNAIVENSLYTAAARGNTNYASKYGLNRITISGTVNAYDD